MVYLIDDKYLFTGDTLWFGADGGYSFISALAEDNKLAVKSLADSGNKAQKDGRAAVCSSPGTPAGRTISPSPLPKRIKLCSPFKKRAPDPTAPYDAYDESDDTEEKAKRGFLKGVGTEPDRREKQ